MIIDEGVQERKLRSLLDKSIVIPCCLRAEDFNSDCTPLECVIVGLRRRWEPRHDETILGQL